MTVYSNLQFAFGEYGGSDVEDLVEKYSEYTDLSKTYIVIGSIIVFIIFVVFSYYLIKLSNYISRYLASTAINFAKFTAEALFTVFIGILLLISVIFFASFFTQYEYAFSEKEKYEQLQLPAP
ncbi:MAG: hypothetical protein GY823_03845 [Flavobacteriaceae bacterium]|nr:hypothetical protein [Flavobacteriaceae bacterium]